MQPALISPWRESYHFHLPCKTARSCKNCHQQQGSFYNLSHHTGALKRSHFFSFGTAFTTNDQFQNISSLPLIGWHTLYKAIYLPIHFRMNASWYEGHTTVTKSSRFAGITTYPISAKSHSSILFKRRKRSRPSSNLSRKKRLTSQPSLLSSSFFNIIPQIIEQKKDTSTQPFIYSSWTIQFIYK